MSGSSQQNRRVVFRGRVQGVGFRVTTRQIAQRFPVTGHVKNLADGSVELVVVADDETFLQFRSAIEDVFGENITDLIVEDNLSGESYSGFEIRY